MRDIFELYTQSFGGEVVLFILRFLIVRGFSFPITRIFAFSALRRLSSFILIFFGSSGIATESMFVGCNVGAHEINLVVKWRPCYSTCLCRFWSW